jgi:hypothetical protein
MSHWDVARASYLTSLDGNREIWVFEISEDIGYTSSFNIDFAIKYGVDGQEYWLNNGGSNYLLGDGPRTFREEIIMADRQLVLNYAATSKHDGYPTYFSGALYVKNLAYNKVNRVVYTTDGWATAREAFAVYNHSQPAQGVEYWSFQVEIDDSATEVEFAVESDQGGTVEWDNNFGLNYLVPVIGEVR